MKKTLILLIVSMNFGVAFASTMCVNNDTVAIVLDPEINAASDSGKYNANLLTWYVDFDYGRVSGISSCNDTEGSYSVAKPDADFEQTHGGQMCWYKMTHPVVSAWVFVGNLSSSGFCSTNCATYCRNRVRDMSAFRGAMFGSVGN